MSLCNLSAKLWITHGLHTTYTQPTHQQKTSDTTDILYNITLLSHFVLYYVVILLHDDIDKYNIMSAASLIRRYTDNE